MISFHRRALVIGRPSPACRRHRFAEQIRVEAFRIEEIVGACPGLRAAVVRVADASSSDRELPTVSWIKSSRP
jgi:hypothetical protein